MAAPPLSWVAGSAIIAIVCGAISDSNQQLRNDDDAITQRA